MSCLNLPTPDTGMEQDHIVVYAFGDQTYDVTGLLSILLLRDDALVSDFVERATRRLQQEIAELGPEQRTECPRFAKLLDLIPFWKAGTLAPALCQALTCFAQIGAFLASHGYERGAKPFPTASTAYMTGICTGLLSAAAVSHSTNSAQLLLLGEECVAVAFRVGSLAGNIGSQIAQCRDLVGVYSSWTAAIVGANVDAVREKVDELDKSISTTAYISAHVSPNQVNITAAPHALHNFISALPAGCSSVLLPVQAPYHAPHLYSESDVEKVLCSVSADLEPRNGLTNAATCIPIVSSVTGKLLRARSFVETLRVVVTECILQVVRYDLLGPAIAAQISRDSSISGASRFTLQPVAFSGPERLESAIRATLTDSYTPQHVESIESLLQRLQQQQQRPNMASRSKIAVLSCAGRFPRASNMETFWDVLLHGVDTHQLVPDSRWDARTHVAASAVEKNVSRTGYGCWLENASAFDAKFFNVSPRESPQIDPAQRIALMCATEALEEAGIVPGRTPSTQHNRIGVYFGVTSNDWMETNSAQNIDTYFIPGGNRAFIAGRVNYHFKFSGPSYSIDTACSSSLTAIQLACNALWRGEIDLAVVGGTNILTNPDMHCGLDRGHFLSRSGNCKTFDASADGYCRGEAVAVVVLKRLEDALQDLDPVQACILSVATNHSAEADSITRPHVGAQRELIDRVLREAGVSGSNISYAEMHGTGTQAGDVAESISVVESLSPPNARHQSEPLYIGSAKANVGHGEAAAGITSLAKVLLMLKHDTIPPHCGIKTVINPKMPDLNSRNTRIATGKISWKRPEGGSRRVLINNFSAAGGNTALILEDAPLRRAFSSPRSPGVDHTVVISAKTAESHRRNVQAMTAWIDRQDMSDATLLPGLAYTSTARRMHHPWRLTATGADLKAIKDRLQMSLDGVGAKRCKSSPKVMFAFAGQGSEFPRMGVELYENVASFRHDIDTYARICVRMKFPPISGFFISHGSWDGATPQALQLAAVCLQMALFRLWLSLGIRPTTVVGHSLGEYPALYAAGVLSQYDVIYLVGKRAALMQKLCEAGSHAMLVVRSSLANIEILLNPLGYRYEIACVNGSRNVVLGGTNAELTLVHAKLTEHGVQTAELPLPYAFHTSQVDPILSDLETLSDNVHFAKPRLPVISPTFADVPSTFSSAFAVAHCRHPVRMLNALESARSQGLISEQTVCIEIGPAAVTSKMIREALGPSTETFVSMRQGEHVSRPFALTLARLYEQGSVIDWNAYHQCFGLYELVLPLPAYNWDLQDYWITYTNDWSLRKGDAVVKSNKPALQSATIHRVVVDNLLCQGGELVLESDLNRKDMGAVVQGHKVYGVPLCTPSVYTDVALTVGQYLKEHIFSKITAMVEIADMIIQSALVVMCGGKTQTLRTIVTLDRVKQTALCTFSSLGSSNKESEQHANCTIRFHHPETAGQLIAPSDPDVYSRMGGLYQKLDPSNNSVYRFSKSMIYKMVASVAEFEDGYRGLSEIVMDNHAFEATGRVAFENPQLLEGNFNIHPACIDALSQLGGFVMNANESTELNSEIFVNHGWRSFQVYDNIDPKQTYRTHARMIEGSDKLWSGDVTIFNGEQVVAKFAGIALQRVPRRLMEYIVNSANARAASMCGIDETRPSAPVDRAFGAANAARRITRNASSFDAVLAIISSESGIALSELGDAQSFDDLGVDSLLSLLIISRIRDELAIELGNSILLDLRNVGALRTYIDGMDLPTLTEHPKLLAEPKLHPGNLAWSSVLEIISQETGISPQELSDASDLADLGVDSLLSLIISSRLQEELNINLQNVSLFIDCDTIGGLRKLVAELSSQLSNDASDAVSESASDSSSSRSSWPSSVISSPGTPLEAPDSLNTAKAWHALAGEHTPRPITIQGNTKVTTQRLFLFPDGGGSATSYVKLPLISADWAVTAFDSPFVRNPHLMEKSSLVALLDMYLTAVRQQQPHGPYHLGGWSTGGILAYAVASKLLAANEAVSNLILIDSPSPANGLDRLPQSFFDHCSSIGIFESEMNERTVPSMRVPVAPPQWLIPHFHATIELLHTYHAIPLPPPSEGLGPSVAIIWAGACAFDDQKYAKLPNEECHSPTEMEGIQFLTRARTDFGPGNWAQLLPGCAVQSQKIEGEHHFSMMRRGAPELARAIRTALGVSQG